jgi:hypothetical protein
MPHVGAPLDHDDDENGDDQELLFDPEPSGEDENLSDEEVEEELSRIAESVELDSDSS